MPKRAERMEQLTKARCAAAMPEGTRYRITDASCGRLKFVVEPGGRRYWTVRYVTPQGKNSEMVLGHWPAMLPELARERARAVENEKRVKDPAQERRDRRQEAAAARDGAKERKAHTFEELTKAYLKASERGNFSGRNTPKAASTLAKERQQLKRHVVPALGSLQRAEVRPADIRRMVAAITTQSGDATANSCLGVIRRVFAFGVEAELVEINPALGIRSRPNRVRDVTAADDQIRALWAALEEAKADRLHPVVGLRPSESYASAAVLQLALLTLQRRGEVASIRRADVDLAKALWTIPAAVKKERRKGAVPLSPPALAILAEAFERSGGEWAFPGANPGEHLRPKTVTRFMARLRTRGTVQEITPHDLRRTGRTRLTGEELRIDSDTAERVLNHTVGSRQQNTYDWNDYTPAKRKALNAWADELDRILRDEPRPSNIVPFAPPASVA